MSRSRRTVLGQLGAATAATLAAPGLGLGRSGRPRAQQRPNILVICTDYQSGKDGPGLGHDFLNMPTLDRLCDEGAVMERHFCTAPICIPSRHTMFTGQYPHTHGLWDNERRWVPRSSPILTQLLQQAGYSTHAVGKLHLNFPPDPLTGYRLGGFDRWISADRKGNFGNSSWDDDYARFLAARGLVRDDYLRLGLESPVPQVYDWPWDPAWHIDAFIGDQLLGIIERDELEAAGKPWFLWAGFCGPHNPWDPPAEFARPYRDMDLPLGNTFPGELATKPTDHTRLRTNYTPEIPAAIDADPGRREEILHAIRASHYGNLTFIDGYVGRMIDALEARGVLDDTIVIWTADHGAHLGDHDLIHKGTHYDSSARVPLVVRYPWVVPNRRVPGFTGHVDLLPTVLGFIGSSIPGNVEGADLSAMLQGIGDSPNNEAFLEVRGNVSIVTDDWKLGLYPADGEGDLYNLATDPEELHNLFGDPAHAEVQNELARRIRDFAPAWPPVVAPD